jgi:hypothetical protein
MSHKDTRQALLASLGALLGACWCWADPVVPEVPLAANRADSEARMQQAAKSAYLRDLAEENVGTIYSGKFTAPAGRYRLHASVSVRPLNDMTTAWLTLALQAGNAGRGFDSLTFGLPDEFTDLTLDFTTAGGDTPVTVTWSFPGDVAATARKKSMDLPMGPAHGTDGTGPEKKDDLLSVDDPEARLPLERAAAMKQCLMMSDIHVEPLSPVSVTALRADKITYTRGETGQSSFELRNASPAAQTVALAVEVEGGFDKSWPVRTETVTVPAGGTLAWKGAFDTKALSWGCALRATATVQGYPPETGTAIFAVPDHFWDVSIMATCPGQMTYGYTTMEGARQAAMQLKDEGYTGFEAYFWAPCDLLDYTPDTETFYSGQTAYIQTITGTRNLIAACHELGIKATFYANLWGGSGEPAFEIMRQHPDWFGSANFHSGALDDAALMTAGLIRGPGHKIWSYNQLNAQAGMPLFDWHVQEILGARKMFGWDGIRYDSYYSAPWTIKAMTHIRDRMNREAPDFLFGYNAFADAEFRVGAMDSISNGMIMAEGARIGPGSKAADFLHALNYWRELSWTYGSAIGPLYGFTGGPEGARPTPLDHILIASIFMAVGGHPYYNLLGGSVGEYPAFALRYAEAVYDTRLRDVASPEKVVAFGNNADPLLWRELVRTCAAGEGRQRLVLHVVNASNETVLGASDMKHLPPLRHVPVRFTLPAGAKPAGAWLLQAYPTVSRQALPVAVDGSAVTLTLPEVRFYGVVVLEFDSKTPLATKTDVRVARELQLKTVQDWWVLGPLAGDMQFSGFETVFPPESGVDLKASYKGSEGGDVTWVRRPPPAVPSPSALSIDFLEQWPGFSKPGVAFAYTRIVSDQERDAFFYTGSDDTITIWLNGEKVQNLKTARPMIADSERIKILLKKGVNTLLVKVCQGYGGWSFVLRLADENGIPVTDGIIVNAGQE